jgi:glycosyltransferase involved in cell wall biosynthesis
MRAGRPRLCFAGPMLGTNPGWVPSQGEILATHFRAQGYEVRLTSSRVRRLTRFVDTVIALVRWRRHVDVLHVMVLGRGPGFLMADLTATLGRMLGLSVVLHLHGGALPEFAVRHPRWVGRVLDHGDALVAPSRYLSSKLPVTRRRITVIPNLIPIDDYPFRLRSRVEPSLLWMRTFHPIYNPDLALEVLARVRARHPDTTLTMAGQDKGELARVRARARELELDGAVRFVGFLDRAGKQREFARNHIFLNTNRIDNMPVSVLEAAAFGLPIVATDVGGIPYLLEHERTALLVADDDAAAMTCAVERLLTEPSLVQALSRNGRSVAEASSWTTVFARWEPLIDEVAGRHATA